MVETPAAEVLHLYVFEPVPNALVWVQIWGVAWKLLQVEPLGRPAGEKRPNVGSPVDREPIPDHCQLSLNLTENVAKKLRNCFNSCLGAASGSEGLQIAPGLGR